MGGSVIFYTYGSTLELNGQQLTAGMLTARIEAPRVKSRKEPVPPAVYSEATEYGQEDS